VSRNKIRELEVLIPILFGEIKQVDEPAKEMILLDSGASGSIISKEFIQKAKRIPAQAPTWRTMMAGMFATNFKYIAEFSLPELNPTASFKQKMYIVPKVSNYDVILGRDFLKVGISFNSNNQSITWNDVSTSMKKPTSANNLNYAIEECYVLQAGDSRLQHILDTKYEKTNLSEIVQECTHLNKIEQKGICSLPSKSTDSWANAQASYTK